MINELERRKAKLTATFKEKFNEEPTDFFSSPGRIELLGNHTDHNNGKVLVASINLAILAAVSRRSDTTVYIHSEGHKDFSLDLRNIHDSSTTLRGTSMAMVEGVLFRFLELGYRLGGFKLTLDSTIFTGAGVSSSAAYELLICQILNYYYNDSKIDAVTLAKIAQFSEREYFGKPCGLLDQMGIALGGVNYVDFQSTEKPLIKHLTNFLKNYSIILVNTGGSHVSLTKFYASIPDEMKKVASYFKKEVLREVDEEDFIKNLVSLKKAFGGRPILRAMHYFSENKRVDEAYEALLQGDELGFLKAVRESGLSSYMQLQNCYYDYDKEQYVTLALSYAASIIKDGAVRVHGGGFAGTILAFVNKKEVTEFQDKMGAVFGKLNCVELFFNPLGTTHLE